MVDFAKLLKEKQLARLNRQMTHQEDENEGGYVSLLNRSRKDIRPAALVPCGVWLLRCVGAKLSTFHDEKANDGRGADIDLLTFSHEPFESISADPEEVNAVDPATGQAPYAGKRIFTKFYIRTLNDADRAARVMDVHFDKAEDGEETLLTDDLESMKGKVAMGEVTINSWKDRSTGENRQDSSVKNWARAE